MIKLIKFIFFLFISYACFFLHITSANEKIKIGLLVPMTGPNKDIGQSIIKAVGLAVKDINDSKIEIFPKTKRKNQKITRKNSCTRLPNKRTKISANWV